MTDAPSGEGVFARYPGLDVQARVAITWPGGRARGLRLGCGGSGGCRRPPVVGGGTRGDVAAPGRDAAGAAPLRGRARSWAVGVGFGRSRPRRSCSGGRSPNSNRWWRAWGARLSGRPSMPRSWWGDRVGSLPRPRWHSAALCQPRAPGKAALYSRSPEFPSFLQRHSLPERRGVAQVSAYVPIKLLVEGLKRGGEWCHPSRAGGGLGVPEGL